jgi:ABC-2 type transport system permease protein
MRRVWIIARHEYMVNLQRPGFIVMTLLVPLLGAVIVGVAALFGGQASNFFERQFSGTSMTGYVDEEGSFTPMLPAYADVARPYADEAAGRQALQSGEIATLVIIPADYLQTGIVRAITKSGGASAAAVAGDSARMRSFMVDHLLRGKVDPALQARAAQPVNLQLSTLDDAGGKGAANSFVGVMSAYFLGIFLSVTIFTTSGYLLRGVAEEKSSRVMEIILSSVSSFELIAGKVLGLGALGLTQVAVWLGSVLALSTGAIALLGVTIPLLTRPAFFLLVLAYYVLGFLLYAVLMGSVGALGTTMQESQQLAGIFSVVAALPMMLGGFMFSNPHMIAARVLSWIPLTAPTMMLLRVAMAEVPAVDLVVSLGGLVLSIPLALWAGAKVFRLGLLMYGKRPALKQVLKALREA